MPRLSRLPIALLPLALWAGAAGAQDPGRPPPAGAQQAGPQARHMAPPPSRQRPASEPAGQGLAASRDRDSMSEAVRHVKRSTGGQILGAERVPYEGGSITRVKYMDDRGRVRYMDTNGPRATERRGPRRTGDGEP